jgi:hypothetical protein
MSGARCNSVPSSPSLSHSSARESRAHSAPQIKKVDNHILALAHLTPGIRPSKTIALGHQSEIASPASKLRKRLPSFLNLSRTVNAPCVPSPVKVSKTPATHPQLTNYMGVMQNALRTMETAEVKDSVSKVESGQSLSSRDFNTDIHRHRSKLLREALRASITTEISPAIRSSLAQEACLRLKCHTKTGRADLEDIQYALQTRGKDYWTRFHAEYELRYQSGNHVDASTEVYNSDDKRSAVLYWASSHNHLTYGEIMFRLSLPPGILWQWILQICHY